MQNGTRSPLEEPARQADCTFCQHSRITDILKETEHFLLAADHAPLVEGHLLIPLLMKGRVNLPPAMTILSQALMAVLFGFLGLMCAVPLLAATMTIVKVLYVEDVVDAPLLERADEPLAAV